MGTGRDDSTPDEDREVDVIPEIRPWREIGWIFKDGDTVTIVRRPERPPAKPHRPDA